MLKFFFHHKGMTLNVVNALAGVLSLAWLGRSWAQGVSPGGWTLLLIAFWAASNALDLYPWYPGIREKRGIRIHFRKSLIPASYFTVFGLALRWVGGPDWTALPVNLLMLVLFYVNAMLLHLHRKDDSTLTPGYYSHNLHLRAESDGAAVKEFS